MLKKIFRKKTTSPPPSDTESLQAGSGTLETAETRPYESLECIFSPVENAMQSATQSSTSTTEQQKNSIDEILKIQRTLSQPESESESSAYKKTNDDNISPDDIENTVTVSSQNSKYISAFIESELNKHSPGIITNENKVHFYTLKKTYPISSIDFHDQFILPASDNTVKEASYSIEPFNASGKPILDGKMLQLSNAFFHEHNGNTIEHDDPESQAYKHIKKILNLQLYCLDKFENLHIGSTSLQNEHFRENVRFALKYLLNIHPDVAIITSRLKHESPYVTTISPSDSGIFFIFDEKNNRNDIHWQTEPIPTVRDAITLVNHMGRAVSTIKIPPNNEPLSKQWSWERLEKIFLDDIAGKNISLDSILPNAEHEPLSTKYMPSLEKPEFLFNSPMLTKEDINEIGRILQSDHYEENIILRKTGEDNWTRLSEMPAVPSPCDEYDETLKNAFRGGPPEAQQKYWSNQPFNEEILTRVRQNLNREISQGSPVLSLEMPPGKHLTTLVQKKSLENANMDSKSEIADDLAALLAPWEGEPPHVEPMSMERYPQNTIPPQQHLEKSGPQGYVQQLRTDARSAADALRTAMRPYINQNLRKTENSTDNDHANASR